MTHIFKRGPNGLRGQCVTKLDRVAIVGRIYERFGKALPKNVINDAVAVLCGIMADGLKKNETISIHNFGTVHTYTFHGHRGVDISSGEIQYVEPFVTVKFVAHDNFNVLLNNKRDSFKINNS